jgi:acyl-coenzyme A thioesterase PaaI-like protein
MAMQNEAGLPTHGACPAQANVMSPRPDNRLTRLIARFDAVPAGIRPALVSKIFGWKVPFVGTAGIAFDELVPGRARLTLSNRRRVRNHLGGIHAVAMTLLAEAASGFVLGLSLPEDKIQLAKSLQVRFLQRAEGDLTAVATLSAAEIGRIRSEERGEVLVRVRITDASGNEPVACEVIWVWVPRRSS